MVQGHDQAGAEWGSSARERVVSSRGLGASVCYLQTDQSCSVAFQTGVQEVTITSGMKQSVAVLQQYLPSHVDSQWVENFPAQ